MTSWRHVETITTFPRRSRHGRDGVRVSISAFGSKYYGDIRLVYIDKETGEIKPKRSGLTLNFLALTQLHEAIGKLLTRMDAEYGGLVSDNPELRAMIETMDQEKQKRPDDRKRSVREGASSSVRV